MVCGRRLHFCGQRGTAAVGKFVRMHLRTEPDFAGLGENTAGLVDREIAYIDEDVAEGCEAVRGNRLQHVPEDEVDVGLRPTTELGRNGMGSEERGADIESRDPSRLDDRSEHLAFVVWIQAVSALRLDGGGAEGRHRPEAIRSLLCETFFLCVPGRPDRLQDPSSSSCDV